MKEQDFKELILGARLCGVYLLHGEEEHTKQRAVRDIKKLLDPSVASMNTDTLRFPDFNALMQCCQTLPFFDSRRLVIVTDWDADLAERLIEKIDSISDCTILLLVKRGVQAATTRLYKALNAMDRVIEYQKLTESRAIDYLVRSAALRGCNLDYSVARRMADMVGLDGYRLQNEMSKLLDYCKSGTRITAAHINTCVTPSAEFKIFNLLNYLLDGNKKEGLKMLKAMLQSGQSALSIAAFLEGRLKALLFAKQQLAIKTPTADIIKQMTGSPKAAEIAIKTCKRHTEAKLSNALIALTRVDQMQKQGLCRDEDALLLAICSCF